jgi:hypothetical protein
MTLADLSNWLNQLATSLNDLLWPVFTFVADFMRQLLAAFLT